ASCEQHGCGGCGKEQQSFHAQHGNPYCLAGTLTTLAGTANACRYGKSTTLIVCQWHMTTVCKSPRCRRRSRSHSHVCCQKSPLLPPMSSEDDTSSPLGEAIGSPMVTK